MVLLMKKQLRLFHFTNHLNIKILHIAKTSTLFTYFCGWGKENGNIISISGLYFYSSKCFVIGNDANDKCRNWVACWCWVISDKWLKHDFWEWKTYSSSVTKGRVTKKMPLGKEIFGQIFPRHAQCWLQHA